MDEHPEKIDHLHDPEFCQICMDLRKVWTGHGFLNAFFLLEEMMDKATNPMPSGFHEAMKVLDEHYNKSISPELNKSWGNLPRSASEGEVARVFERLRAKFERSGSP